MVGKSRSAMGWIDVDVAIGEASQSSYESLIRYMAAENPAATTRNQNAFHDFVGALEM